MLELVNKHWVKLVNTQMENLNYKTVIVLVVLNFYLIYMVRLGFSFDLKNSGISYTTETKWKEKLLKTKGPLKPSVFTANILLTSENTESDLWIWVYFSLVSWTLSCSLHTINFVHPIWPRFEGRLLYLAFF